MKNAMKNEHIFLLPFAGGSSLIYNTWKFNNLDPHPIEYSGHGFRYQEPLAVSMEDIVKDVTDQIQQIIPRGEDKFILFGHSMGGLAAWLTAQKLKPSALYVSACEPPDLLDARRYEKYGNEDALMSYIRDYQRLSEKRMKSKIFLDKLLPVIKNDYRILSEYKYEAAGKLDIPVKIFFSKEDTLMRHEIMQSWSEFGSDVQFYKLSGDHFYIEDDNTKETIISLIEEMEKPYRII